MVYIRQIVVLVILVITYLSITILIDTRHGRISMSRTLPFQSDPSQSHTNASKVPSYAKYPKNMGVYLAATKRLAAGVRRSPAISWCKRLGFRIASRTSPVTALASFPGSGNTWLRYLIQQASGLMTGSVYQDQTLLKNGFPGEGIQDGRVIVVKTHELRRSNYTKAILIIRDPYEAILAEFNRQNGGHIGHARPKAFMAQNWHRLKSTGAGIWEKTAKFWHNQFLNNPQNLLVVHYALLKNDTEHQLRRILDFLNVEVTDKTMQCVMSRKEGNYHRKKKKIQGQIFDAQTKKLIDASKEAVYEIFPFQQNS